MKKQIITVSLLLSLTANAQNIDLQSVIKQAITVSNESKIAIIKRSNSNFDLSIAKSAFFPKVSFAGSATRRKESFIQDTTATTLNSLVLTYNLYNGGKDVLAVTVAELQKAKATLEFYNSINDIVLSTTQLYFKIISETELLKSYKVAEKRASLSMEIEKTRFEEGVSNKISYLRAESAYYNFKSLRINAEALLDGINSEFIRIVGTAPPAVLPIPVLDFVTIPETLTESQLQAKGKNLSLLIANINTVIAGKEVEIASNTQKPTLSFKALTSRNQDYQESWSAGVEYILPLYTGNKITANIGKEENNKKLMQQVLSKTVSDVNIGVISAWKKYLASQGTAISLQKALLTSTMITEATNIRYDSGEMSVTELMETQQEHLTIKKRYYDALSQRAMAKLNLLNITGGLDIRLVSADSTTPGVK